MAGTKRAGVYTIRKNGGKLDSYMLYALKELKKVTDALLVISEDRELCGSAQETLKSLADQVITAEEADFPQWQLLRPFFQKYGTDCREAVFLDSDVFGPFWNLEEFLISEKRQNADFFGIKTDKPGRLESWFWTVSESLLNEDAWRKLSGCARREGISRKRLQNAEISAGSVRYENLRDYPKYSIEKQKCLFWPVSFFQEPYGDILDRHSGEAIPQGMEFLKKHSTYDTDMIWEHLLRIMNMADLKKVMQCNYVLSSRTLRKKERNRKLKIALILHIYYDDLAPVCRKYAESMPEGTDVYVTAPNEEKMEKVKAAFEDFPYHTEFRIVGNVGRDVGPFIVGCKDIVFRYDLICKMHDKRVFQVIPMSVGESWSYKCFESMLKNKIYVENVISVFEDNPRLGMLAPPPPMHGPYYATVGFGEWSINYGVAEKLAGDLGLTVPMEPDKEPVAPLGSMFWFRPESLKCLFAHDWTYEELPREPIASDCTILHAIERIYPFCMQQEGYYCGWTMADTYARIEVNNWRYYNGELGRAYAHKVVPSSYKEFLEQIRQ